MLAKQIASQRGYIKRNYLAPNRIIAAYMKYSILRPVLKIFYKLNTRKYGKESPWLTPESIEFLDKVLHKGMKGLEYGLGRGTLFISARLGKLISVEHDNSWHDILTAMLIDRKINNVEYKLIPPSKPESKSWIEKRNATVFDFEIDNYDRYFNFIVCLPENHFDFILIDGRARVECSRRAIDILKSGGIFILDNSERTRYKPVHDMLNGWQKVHTTTGLTDTTIWFKLL